MAKARPKHLDLRLIKLPIPAIVSIMHRVSGAGMFLMLPFVLWLLQSSLQSPTSYVHFTDTLAHPLVKLILLGLLWAFLHHFCAGIRYLLLDLDKGGDLATARLTSWIVLAVSVVMTLFLGAKLW